MQLCILLCILCLINAICARESVVKDKEIPKSCEKQCFDDDEFHTANFDSHNPNIDLQELLKFSTKKWNLDKVLVSEVHEVFDTDRSGSLDRVEYGW